MSITPAIKTRQWEGHAADVPPNARLKPNLHLLCQAIHNVAALTSIVHVNEDLGHTVPGELDGRLDSPCAQHQEIRLSYIDQMQPAVSR